MKNNNSADQIMQLMMDEEHQEIKNVIKELERYNSEQCDKISTDRRKNFRKEINISGMIKLTMNTNEILFLPVVIKNISRKGMLLALHDKGYVFVEMLDRITDISVSFIAEDKEISTVHCLPKHVQLKEHINVGVEMLREDKDLIHKYLM